MIYRCKQGHEMDSASAWPEAYVHNWTLGGAECIPCPWCVAAFWDEQGMLMEEKPEIPLGAQGNLEKGGKVGV